MGAYTELVDFTFTANETSRTFSGLSITKDDFVKVLITHVNNASAQGFIKLFPNTTSGVGGNDTDSNYTLQLLRGSGTTIVAARVSANELVSTDANKTSQYIAYFKISENNKFNLFSNGNQDIGTNVVNRFIYTTSHNLTFSDPITSLTFTHSAASGIGTGSRIQIYRLDAVKEADITVASNTTQVDISNLSIDKDSEYLLVSDLIGGTVSNGNFRLMVNDNTTVTAYHSQRIIGDGSTASAARENAANFMDTDSSIRSLTHSHIKLSNIGAYTSQNYMLYATGSSSIRIANRFISSTAENITSITKLNIVAVSTNGIGAGSRFTLYKLYE